MTRDCGHSTGDGPETADTVQEMDQRLRTQYRRWTRDCGHSTGDGPGTADTAQEMDQRMRTQYRRRPENADNSTGNDQRLQTVQGMTRDCRQYRE
ncbi:unnamed protein product [Staurois parvus]|uniref:Uncharacterized protein n=1 Tax=Staurois parvus TaxID=386267 RepID=A0ABN9CAD9_9NEOB|nr:unnamed protein product [Staurois parvus]